MSKNEEAKEQDPKDILSNLQHHIREKDQLNEECKLTEEESKVLPKKLCSDQEENKISNTASAEEVEEQTTTRPKSRNGSPGGDQVKAQKQRRVSNKQNTRKVYKSKLIQKSIEGEKLLHPIEQLMASNTKLITSSTPAGRVTAKIIEKHFKYKRSENYKSEGSVTDMPRDFGGRKGKQPYNVSNENMKYYRDRYFLFSKFDEGIVLDEESWYSVTPEELAEHIARKLTGKKVLDAFCGAGGNSIQFARYCSDVYSNDISQDQIDMAINNATVYGVQDKIHFINMNLLKLQSADFDKEVDCVFISPPWGGIQYSKESIFDLEQIKPSFEGILDTVTDLAPNLMLFLPRNTNLDQLMKMISKYPKLFDIKGECLITIEPLIYGTNNIKALLILIGPLFVPKMQQVMQVIKNIFLPDTFDSYQAIITQNLMEVYSIFFVYESAQILHTTISPTEFIAKLKDLMPNEMWKTVRKLHKFKNVGITQKVKEIKEKFEFKNLEHPSLIKWEEIGKERKISDEELAGKRMEPEGMNRNENEIEERQIDDRKLDEISEKESNLEKMGKLAEEEVRNEDLES